MRRLAVTIITLINNQFTIYIGIIFPMQHMNHMEFLTLLEYVIPLQTIDDIMNHNLNRVGALFPHILTATMSKVW